MKLLIISPPQGTHENAVVFFGFNFHQFGEFELPHAGLDILIKDLSPVYSGHILGMSLLFHNLAMADHIHYLELTIYKDVITTFQFFLAFKNVNAELFVVHNFALQLYLYAGILIIPFLDKGQAVLCLLLVQL